MTGNTGAITSMRIFNQMKQPYFSDSGYTLSDEKEGSGGRVPVQWTLKAAGSSMRSCEKCCARSDDKRDPHRMLGVVVGWRVSPLLSVQCLQSQIIIFSFFVVALAQVRSEALSMEHSSFIYRHCCHFHRGFLTRSCRPRTLSFR